MTQLTLFAEPCRRCAELFAPHESDFFCDACSRHLDRTHTTFKRPLTPQTLWNRIGWDYRRISDAELVKVYQYTMFANALGRDWNYQFYHWPQRLRCPLSQWAGADNLERLRQIVTERGLAIEADNYHIDCAAIKAWIAAQGNS